MHILLMLVLFILGILLNADAGLRFWSSLLIANWFFLLISISGIFLISLHHLSNAKWSVPLLPVLREFRKGIPFLSFSFLVMLAGSGYLFRIDEQNSYKIIRIAVLTVSASAMMFFVYFFDDIFRSKKFTEKQRSIIQEEAEEYMRKIYDKVFKSYMEGYANKYRMYEHVDTKDWVENMFDKIEREL